MAVPKPDVMPTPVVENPTHITTHKSKYMRVKIVPMLEGFMDNYTYIVQCISNGYMAILDPVEPEKGITHLQEMKLNPEEPLKGTDFEIWTTHHHWDHSDGNVPLKKKFPELKIRGGVQDNCPGVTHPVDHKDSYKIGELTVDIVHVPCHTKGHMLYHVYHPEDRDNGIVFTGDTVFVGGIGAWMEGNAEMMVPALQRFAALPPKTLVYPGHEYAVNFLDYAATLETGNTFLEEKTDFCKKQRKNQEPAVATTVEDEIKINPFVRAAVGGASAAPLFKHFGVSTDDQVALMDAVYNSCP